MGYRVKVKVVKAWNSYESIVKHVNSWGFSIPIQLPASCNIP